MIGLDPRLWQRAVQAAAWLRDQPRVTVVHHIDADGVTSGAIATACLERAGIPFGSIPAKSLDDVHIGRIQDGGHEALWFCDFGSTAYMHFDNKIVCDHHQLVRDGSEEDFPHVNPLLDDIPGETISGAGCAFLVALALDAANIDLLPVALVGAAADLQDRPREGQTGFWGSNKILVEHGIEQGLIEVARDLSWFGPETRTLHKFLAYAEPGVPGVTGSRRTADGFLADLDIRPDQTWSALDDAARQRIRDAIVERLIDVGLHDRVDGLFRDVVRISAEKPGTPVRELQEFGTLLNSTARYGEPEVGLAVARGDRGKAYDQAIELLQGHRQHLVKSLDAFRTAGIDERTGIQCVHLQDHVRDTVVGIVCGMALDGLGLRKDMPLIGMAYTDDGRTKVSGRAPNEIQGRIDLATAMRDAAAAHDGQGGGHRGAAGATIPRDAEQAFLAHLDGIVAAQLGRARAAAPPASAEEEGGGSSERVPEAPWQGTGQTRLF